MAWHAVIQRPKVSPDLLPLFHAYVQPPKRKTGRYICDSCNVPVDRINVDHLCIDCADDDLLPAFWSFHKES